MTAKSKPEVTIPVSTDPTKNFGSFTNAAGESFVIHGLSPLLPEKIMEVVRQDWAKNKKALPARPTYEIATASGEVEAHEHDETTLVVAGDEKQTKANQDKWLGYLKTQAEFDGDYNTRLMRVVLMGVEATPTDAWREEMEFIGVALPPKASMQEKYLYVETHVVQSPQDIAKLMTGVFRVAGIIGEEAIAEVEATFQRALEKAFAEAGKSIGKAG